MSWVYGARSANAAKASAEDAQKVRKAELEREHRDYGPVLKDMEFVWKRNSRTDESLQFLTYRLPKTYRVYGDIINENGSRTPMHEGLGGPLEAGAVQRHHVGYAGHQPKAVELRFFPPVDGDPGESWSCPCDRPAIADAEGKGGHWVIREEVPPLTSAKMRFIS